jgi:secreted PhoX family phosphatase
VRKEVAAHGISVVEVRKKGAAGTWCVVATTAASPPAPHGSSVVRSAAASWSKTKYSPNGTMTRGTINNCAHGYTPWGTYLTCEENWAGYFVNIQLTRIDALFDALGFVGHIGAAGQLLRALRRGETRSSASLTRPSTRRSPATCTGRPATP